MTDLNVCCAHDCGRFDDHGTEISFLVGLYVAAKNGGSPKAAPNVAAAGLAGRK